LYSKTHFYSHISRDTLKGLFYGLTTHQPGTAAIFCTVMKIVLSTIFGIFRENTNQHGGTKNF